MNDDINESKLDTKTQNKYIELFNNAYNGTLKTSELKLNMSNNDLTIVDMAILSKDETKVMKLFEYLQINKFFDNQHVRKLVSCLLSYKKYNILELLFSNMMTNTIGYLLNTL